MLISENKNFLYYHLYKVAGTSIRSCLRPYCSRNQIFLQNANYVSSILWKKFSQNPLYDFHPNLSDVKTYLGGGFYSYYRFTFVREPLDWQKSLYFFSIKNSRHHQHKIIKDMSFEQYIDWRINFDFKLQSDLIYDGDELLVDDVFKFENIVSDYLYLKKKLGLSKDLVHKNVAGQGKSVELSKAYRNKFFDAFEADYLRLGYEIRN